MKRLLFLLLTTSNLLFAQQQRKLDSLKAVLAKLPADGSSFIADTMRVKVLCEMGESINDYDENTLKSISEALMISERINWEIGQILSLNSLGRKFLKMNNLFKAVDVFLKSLYLSEKLLNLKQQSITLRHLGGAYYLLGEYKTSEAYYLKSLKIQERLKDQYNLLLCYNNLSLVYFKQKKYQENITLLNKCLTINKVNKIKKLDGYFYNNLGQTYFELNNNNLALKNYNNALEIYKDIDDPTIKENISIALYGNAKVYERTGDYDKSILLCNQSLRINQKLNLVKVWQVNELLFQIFEKKGNEKLALKYHKLFTSQKDSLDKLDFKKRLQSLSFEYENKNQKNEISLLSKDIQTKSVIQNVLFLGFALFVLFIGFLVWNNRILKNKNNQINLQNSLIEDLNKNLEKKVDIRTAELLEANQELLRKNNEITEALFKGQSIERKRVAIELHDNLGGMLSGMKWRLEALNKDNLSEKEKNIYEGIQLMMNSAYSEVRLISHNMLPAELENKGLVGALEKLCADISSSEKLELILFVSSDNLQLDKKIELEVYGICMELVNNILKHSGANKAKISISQDSESLKILVKDNGKGMNTNLDTNGIGMKNIKNRVDSINGTMSLETSKSGTIFSFSFALGLN